MSMKSVNKLKKYSKPESNTFNPVFFRLKNDLEKLKLNGLLESENTIEIFDEILGQVQEFVKSKNPKKIFTKQELKESAEAHLGDSPHEEYGVWVYYSWSKRLVHILDEEEFIFVRTSRNQYKISPEEQKTLSQKKIGIIGLSVGQSVSLTLAMERICGELRLADFDILELTNLNRIRTGIHNLGLPKVYSVAREIMEIDPFIKVKCYPEGLTEANMDDFFNIGGKLDLLVEESDGFDIKILSRYKARELGIPVIMEASDKCMIDVERFDLEPDRKILHGLVDHLDVSTLKKLKTNEEKIPYMLDILGLDTASVRLKASMLEIEQTINTWPQLASAVTMGGGITADVSRRLLLNQHTQSGRYHIDIEELIGDKILKENIANKTIDLDYPELTLKEMESISKSVTDNTFSKIDENDLKKIVECAVIAPSAGNNQPWKWLAFKDKLFLFHNKKNSISWADYKNIISYISFGTAIENIELQSNALGYKVKTTLFPLENNIKLIATFSFEKNELIGKTKSTLHQFIFTRCTNRKKGTYSSIDQNVIEDLKSECENIEGAKLFLTGEKDEIEKISKIVSVSERIRFLNPQGHHDFYSKEIKWTSKDGSEILEGLDIKTLELNHTDELGLRVAADPKIIELLNTWNAGSAFEKLSYKSILTSSAIGLITMPVYSDQNWINGGRAVQRVWLNATKHHLAVQPISAPLFLHLQKQNGGSENFNNRECSEVEKCHSDLAKIFTSLEKNTGLFMFRLSHADPPGTRSLRKHINDLYFKI